MHAANRRPGEGATDRDLRLPFVAKTPLPIHTNTRGRPDPAMRGGTTHWTQATAARLHTMDGGRRAGYGDAMTHGNDRILPGVALMLGFCLIAPGIDVSAKLASATLAEAQITAARFIVQGVLMLPIVLIMGMPFRMTPRAFWLVLARAAVAVAFTFSFVGAVSVMPVADALAITFVEPFIVLLLGRLMFGDEVGPRRIGAAVVGFGGSLLVIQPSFAAFGLVALLPLATAFFFAIYLLITRALSREMHPVPMQFHTAWVGAAICLPVLVLAEGSGIASLDASMPEGRAWVWLLFVGVFATISHMMVTYALRFAPSATLAPLHYLEIVAAVILGYLVFADFPNALTWAGIGVIVASGLYIIRRERQLDRQRRAQVQTTPTSTAPAEG